MKDTRPTYLNESVEISDVIQASTVAIAYVTRGTKSSQSIENQHQEAEELHLPFFILCCIKVSNTCQTGLDQNHDKGFVH